MSPRRARTILCLALTLATFPFEVAGRRGLRAVTAVAASGGSAPADWGPFMIGWHNLDQNGTAVRPNLAGPTSCGGTGSNCDYRPFVGSNCGSLNCDATPCTGGSCSIPVDTVANHFAEGTGGNLFGPQGNGLGKVMGCAMPTCSALDPPAGHNLTWGLWVRPTTSGHYMDLQDADSSAQSVGGYYHDLEPGGHHVCLVAENHNGSGTEWEYFAQSPAIVPANTLSHLACSWDQSTRTLSNLINGVVVQSCGPGQGGGNCGCFCNGATCGSSPCNNTTPNYTPSIVNRYILGSDSTPWMVEGDLDEDFNFDGLMLPSDVCRIRALGIQGARGWCDQTDPTQYKVCRADTDCRDATHSTGVCDLTGCSPGVTCRCTGRLSGGPSGCRTLADLPACNVPHPADAGGGSDICGSGTGAPISRPHHVSLSAIGSPGDGSFNLQGTMAFPAPVTPPLDPVENGVAGQIVAADGHALAAFTVPGGAGWTRNGARWRYRNQSGSIRSATLLVAQPPSTTTATVKVRIRGRNATLGLTSADGPFTLVLRAGSVAAQCGFIDFGPDGCTFSGSGTMLRCR